MKLVTLTDPDELYETLDFVAQKWGDYDMSNQIPLSLSHEV
jgi:hypothetical protein